MALNTEEMVDWEKELNRLQALKPVEASRNRLRDVELPALEQQIKEQDALVPVMSGEAEEARHLFIFCCYHLGLTSIFHQALEKLNDLKREIKEILSLKQHTSTVSRLCKELERINQEITDIENELSATGSTKTAEDVQLEIDAISHELYEGLGFY